MRRVSLGYQAPRCPWRAIVQARAHLLSFRWFVLAWGEPEEEQAAKKTRVPTRRNRKSWPSPAADEMRKLGAQRQRMQKEPARGQVWQSGVWDGGFARLIRYLCLVCGLWVQRSGRKKNLSPQAPSCPLPFLVFIERSKPFLSPRILSTTLRKKVRSVHQPVAGSVLVYFFSDPLPKKPTQKNLKTTKKTRYLPIDPPPTPKKQKPKPKSANSPSPSPSFVVCPGSADRQPAPSIPLASTKSSRLYRSLVLCLPSPLPAHGILASPRPHGFVAQSSPSFDQLGTSRRRPWPPQLSSPPSPSPSPSPRSREPRPRLKQFLALLPLPSPPPSSTASKR